MFFSPGAFLSYLRHRSAHPTLSYIRIRPQARTADGYRTGGGRRRQRFDTTSVVSDSCPSWLAGAAAAAELQSWGRLLIEEHDATIHVRYLRSRTRVRAGYRTRDHEGGQFGYTWGAAEVGAALYAEHSTHCLYSVLLYASAPAVEQR